MMHLPEKNKDPLRKIVSSEMLDQPPAQFTASVMGRLGLSVSPSIKYEPVISLRGWLMIGIVFITLCILGLSGTDSPESFSGIDQFRNSVRYSTTVFENLFAGSFTIILTVSAMAVLLLFAADGLYRRSRLQAT
jgi:hypothetical protein